MPAYIGRFAPSPTGPLHFGSLVAALGSFLDARTVGGSWLLRMEDVDTPRCSRAAAGSILRTLEALGFAWDGDIMVQSRRADAYRAALDRLRAGGWLYPCACTRKEIADSRIGIDGARVYPGTCRAGLPPGREARAWRLRVGDEPIAFDDRLQGRQRQNLAQEVGDFVLLRADALYAYQLAVVVDDAEQGVSDVVRGADLLASTPRQIWLQRLLGLPAPRYLHLPVALDGAGEKLSKQTHAAAIDARAPGRALCAAARFLGLAAPAGMETAAPREFWQWALAAWDTARLPRALSLPAPLAHHAHEERQP